MNPSLTRCIAIFLAALLFSPNLLAAEPESTAASETLAFAGPTAYTVAPGRFEVGLFGPLRYGLTENVELSTHPIWFFVAPNLRAKVAWHQGEHIQVSTNSSITYPTPILRLLSMEGAGGVHPPDRAIPHIVSLFNEVVATTDLGGHYLSAGAGIQIAPTFGESQMVSIDVAVVYPRTAAFFTTATGHLRAHLLGPIAGPLHYELSAQAFLFPGADGSFALEQSTGLRWQSCDCFSAQAGLLLTHGAYPFGTDTRLLPLFELAWAF